jgi:hypothetical protein
VGAELASFGIPVVVPSNSDFYTYPSEINRIGHSRMEFTAEIDRALREGWSIENTRRAFRWFAFLFTRVAVDFSDAVNSRPIAIRPKKPGWRLAAWKKLVFLVIQFGPLVRERLSLRNRRLAPTSQEILLDVITSALHSASDSALWPPVVSSLPLETELLEGYLVRLTATLWKDIDEPGALPARIHAGLAYLPVDHSPAPGEPDTETQQQDLHARTEDA